MLSMSMQKGRYLCLAIVVVCFLVHGCGKGQYKTKENRIVRKMLVTGYDAGKKSTGWKRKWSLFFLPPVYAYGPNEGKRKEVGITSDGTKAKKGTIAADITRYPYGTKMYVPGYGWGEVHDIGSAIKGEHIDLFFPSEKDAKAWGKKNLDVIILLRE
ncbi:MAG: 3D domain-containing protein [Deltaproteobacteria bacterium]|nr:3D domain-containing protein [Deltaproteobacteria bacterium]